MSVIEAVLLGVLQGLTEFLPISSSGHLAIFQNLFHIGNGTEDLFLFDILLHLGTLIAIVVVFYRDVLKMIVEGFGILGDSAYNVSCLVTKAEKKKVVRNGYRKLVLMILVSTIPTGIIGVLLSDLVKEAGKTLIMPGIFLIITACLLFLADRMPEGYKLPRDANYFHALVIGIAQGFATLPGISRSGTTITTSLLCGFEKKFAFKYSILMSIPAVLGACVLEISDAAGTKFEPVYLVGMLVSAVVGYFAIRLMLTVVKKKKYIYFSIYCLIAGLTAIIGSFIVKH